MKRKCLCYVILPTFSVIGLLGVSWLIAAFIEIFTNNLTMIRIIETNLMSSHLVDDVATSSNQDNAKVSMGSEDDNLFWFVQVILLLMFPYFPFIFIITTLIIKRYLKFYDFFSFCLSACIFHFSLT